MCVQARQNWGRGYWNEAFSDPEERTKQMVWSITDGQTKTSVLIEDAAANMAENQQPRRYPVNSISPNRVYSETEKKRGRGRRG